jgi:predicted amidohydrolase
MTRRCCCCQATHQAPCLTIATTAMHCEEDPAANREKMAVMVRAVKAEHPETRLILFGELCLGWFWHGERRGRSYDDVTLESLEYHERIAEPIPGPTTELVGNLAREYAVYIAFGMGERTEGKPYNALVLVGPSGAVVAKRHQARLACGMFQASDELATITEVDGVRTALLICSDTRSGAVCRATRRARPALVLHAMLHPHKETISTRVFAAFWNAWVVTSNHFGGEPEPPSRYPGLVVAVDSYGRLVRSQIGEEGYAVAEVPTEAPCCRLARVTRRLRADLAFVALLRSIRVARRERRLKARD